MGSMMEASRKQGRAPEHPLLDVLFVGQHRQGVHFAAGAAHGQDHEDGQSFSDRNLALERRPEVLEKNPRGHGLGGVDDAAAPHRQHRVHLFLLGQGDDLPGLGQHRVGPYPPGLRIGEPGLLQGPGHGVVDPVLPDGPAPGHQQHALNPRLLNHPADLPHNILPENNPGRIIKSEVFHECTPFSFSSPIGSLRIKRINIFCRGGPACPPLGRTPRCAPTFFPGLSPPSGVREPEENMVILSGAKHLSSRPQALLATSRPQAPAWGQMKRDKVRYGVGFYQSPCLTTSFDDG